MNPLDVNSSLYFSATQSVLNKKSEELKKTKQKKLSPFKKRFEAAQKVLELEAAGLPVEIADMTDDDAIIYLKDAADLAGDELTDSFSPEAFKKYRKTISQFLIFIEKNNFEIIKHKRFGFNRKGKPRDPLVQVQVINNKLDQLASEMMYNHRSKLKLLGQIDELKGLIVDLLAS